MEKDNLKKVETKPAPIERTRNRRTFVPHTDIIERETALTVVMDVPGALEKDIDIHLENDVLTVTAKVEEEVIEGYRPLYSEYSIGDFQRSFKLIEAFDPDKIEAKLSQGVLTLVLPKSEKVKPRKILVKSST
jgi:HSP20 family protein